MFFVNKILKTKIFLIRFIERITGQLIDYQNKSLVMAVNRLKYLIAINRMIDMS